MLYLIKMVPVPTNTDTYFGKGYKNTLLEIPYQYLALSEDSGTTHAEATQSIQSYISLGIIEMHLYNCHIL